MPGSIIALAQVRSTPGDVTANVARHLLFAERAAAAGAALVVFPELSLTNYEPSLAAKIALDAADNRLDPLQRFCDRTGIALAAGAPLRGVAGVHIALILFQPHKPRQKYTKSHLHADEELFFVAATSPPVWPVAGIAAGLAICYELSVPEHARRAAENGADLYLASVAKSAAGVAAAGERLAAIARSYDIPALMVNAVGPAEGFENAGGSAVWDRHGRCRPPLPPDDEALLLYDIRSSTTTIETSRPSAALRTGRGVSDPLSKHIPR